MAFPAIFSAGQISKWEKELEPLTKSLAEQEAKRAAIYDTYGLDLQKKAVSESTPVAGQTTTNAGNGQNAGKSTPLVANPNKDRLAELQQWYEQQKTLAAASYTSGETDYQAYLDTLDRLQTEYLQKVSNDNSVSLKDRTDAALQLAEQARKQKEQADKDALQRQYAEETAMLKQRLADGEITEIEEYSQSETAGYFKKVFDANRTKYIGKNVAELGSFDLVDTVVDDNDIDKVSTATLTSTGLNNAVNAAAYAFNNYKEASV